MANLSFFFTLVGFLRRSQLLELRSALLFCSIIFFNWFPSTGIDGANMDRVEELAHVRRQAAAENERDYNVGQSYCEKAIFGPKVLTKKGAGEVGITLARLFSESRAADFPQREQEQGTTPGSETSAPS